MEMACLLSSFMTVNSALFVIVSDISSDIPYEKPVASATIVLLEAMIQCNGGMMTKLSETELKKLIKGGETNTVELKLAAPRAVDLAERLCGMGKCRWRDSNPQPLGIPLYLALILVSRVLRSLDFLR
jgi:hypothetical protein